MAFVALANLSHWQLRIYKLAFIEAEGPTYNSKTQLEDSLTFLKPIHLSIHHAIPDSPRRYLYHSPPHRPRSGWSLPHRKMSYNDQYGDGNTQLSTLACSRLIPEYGYKTIGDFPVRSQVYAARVAPTVGLGNEDSTTVNCGGCYQLRWLYGLGNQDENTNHINRVIVVDSAEDGFIVPESAFNLLTNGSAQSLGSTDVVFTELDREECGFPTLSDPILYW
ncbi:hypothetical protein D9758_014014 [Tetrapyrgos nigripes]|uniref:Uncharacterized protein n=1 Tax=Tetrapyrgos nigripes TaxID=182062 RepID=A0A8H5CXH4_9AGAR|nr:hypothetical protein D9758_014014 [Tetrapyrgos nigripes]